MSIPSILTYLNYTPLFDIAGTTLIQRVKQHIYMNGLTQEECAKEFGVAPETIRSITRGLRISKEIEEKMIPKVYFVRLNEKN